LHRKFQLPIILIISIGFSSNVFATEDSILYSSESNFYSPFNYNLNDGLPITLDQFTSDSILYSSESNFDSPLSKPISDTIIDRELKISVEYVKLSGEFVEKISGDKLE